MRILDKHEYSAQQALSRIIDKETEYRGYKVLSHYYMRHNFCEVVTPSNEKLPIILTDECETTNEFNKAVRDYIDNCCPNCGEPLQNKQLGDEYWTYCNSCEEEFH